MMGAHRRAGVAQLVERVLAKHEVDGSKPFTRSKNTPKMQRNSRLSACPPFSHLINVDEL